MWVDASVAVLISALVDALMTASVGTLVTASLTASVDALMPASVGAQLFSCTVMVESNCSPSRRRCSGLATVAILLI